MAWTIEFEEQAKRDLSKLDKSVQREIMSHALVSNLSGLWRYRVRDYRIICKLEQDRLVVLVVAVGHRSKVYK